MGFKKTVEIDGEEKEIELQGVKNSNEDTFIPMLPMHLHGRRQIFTNESSITRDNVVSVLNAAMYVHSQNRAEEVYLEKYIRGIQPILDRQKKYNAEITNRIVMNVANQIVTFKTAEFAGEPIQYISRGSKKSVPKKVEKLNSLMLTEGKQSKDMNLAYKMFTNGVGYRLVLNDKAVKAANGELYDEAPFEVFTLDPRNTFVIRANDVTKRILAGVYYVYLDKQKNRVQYTVYTANETFTLEGTSRKVQNIAKVDVHNFGFVPLIEYPCNSLYMSPIEVVHDLLNALSDIASNRVDGIEQFIQAMMVFEGVDIDQATLDSAKAMGAIKLPPTADGKSGHLYYLNEQLDQSQTQTLVNDIYQTILEIVGMPSQGNGNTSDSSNNGAVIMKNGWWNAEARSLETEGMWKESETTFLKIVLKICDDANVLSGLSVADVEPKFGRRSYEDLLTKTQSFSTLRSAGMPSIQAFTFSKLSKDPESDSMVFDAYQEERVDALNKAVGLTGGGGNNVNSSSNDEDESENDDDGDEQGGEYGVCPVCGKKFKKRNGNQIYDRDICRQNARRQKGFGGIR